MSKNGCEFKFCTYKCFESRFLSNEDCDDLMPVIYNHMVFLSKAIDYLEKENENGLFHSEIVVYRNKFKACQHFMEFYKVQKELL